MTKSKLVLGIIVILASAGAVWYFVAPSRVATPDVTGTIEGTTMYPSDEVPQQIVCAQLVNDPAKTYCGQAPEGRSDALPPQFKLEVPPGNYYVYAMLKDPASIGSDLGGVKAYYTQYVPCGLRYDCKDHTKITVPVQSGQTIKDIKPYDWYAIQP